MANADEPAAELTLRAVDLAFLFAAGGPYPATYPGFGAAAGYSEATMAMLHCHAGGIRSVHDALADGSSMTVSAQSTLFMTLGDRFAGSNFPVFTIPDMRGRVPIGNGFAGDAPAGTLALSWLIAAKFAPEWGYGPGLLTLFAGRNAPDGWIVADGRLIKIAAEPALFAAIGSRFGGDGLGNFALPDLRGRTVIGAGERPGEDPLMPGQVVNAAGPGGIPALALHYLICVQGMFANFERFSGFGTRLPFVGQIMASASEEVSDDWIRAEGQMQSKQRGLVHMTLGERFGTDSEMVALPDLRGRIIQGSDGVPPAMVRGDPAAMIDEARRRHPNLRRNAWDRR